MIRRKQILETACNWRWCTHSLSDDRMGIRRLCYVTHVVSPAPRYPNNWPYSGLRPIFEPWRTGYAVQHAGASFKMAAGGRKSPTNHVTAKANLPATRLCHVSHREITTSLGGRIASHRSTSSRRHRHVAAAAMAVVVVLPIDSITTSTPLWSVPGDWRRQSRVCDRRALCNFAASAHSSTTMIRLLIAFELVTSVRRLNRQLFVQASSKLSDSKRRLF